MNGFIFGVDLYSLISSEEHYYMDGAQHCGNYDPFWHRKWIKALRSGEYMQIKSYLHTENGFCCLGVACDIDGETWEKSDGKSITRPEYVFVLPEYHYESSMLPEEVKKQHGVYVNTGLLAGGMNDAGWTFDEIADALEVWLP